PFLYEQWQPHQLDYVKKQLEALIGTAEIIAGKTMQAAQFERVMRRAKDATELWLQILEMGRYHPSPITAFDEYILMAPIVDLRGEQNCVDFYAGLLRELQQRVEKGEGAIRQERYRVLWDNLPVWFKIGRMSRFFAERHVSVVASTYTYAWGEIAPLLNVNQPLDSMAKAYLYPILNRSAGQKLTAMKTLVEKFSIDGVLLHSDKSCKPYSLGQIDQRDEIIHQLNKPAMLLHGDHNDSRAYSDEQAQTRIEAFIEMMEAA
ncbi:MAG TPA: 2-hydroxyacyl-CoA dehydratase family protein, partial [Pseudomonadales bacterium]|nr:2-hydroxyacyl-CoA dehydratase family protein [Pseudomonadales bacterium]